MLYLCFRLKIPLRIQDYPLLMIPSLPFIFNLSLVQYKQQARLFHSQKEKLCLSLNKTLAFITCLSSKSFHPIPTRYAQLACYTATSNTSIKNPYNIYVYLLHITIFPFFCASWKIGSHLWLSALCNQSHQVMSILPPKISFKYTW